MVWCVQPRYVDHAFQSSFLMLDNSRDRIKCMLTFRSSQRWFGSCWERMLEMILSNFSRYSSRVSVLSLIIERSSASSLSSSSRDRWPYLCRNTDQISAAVSQFSIEGWYLNSID